MRVMTFNIAHGRAEVFHQSLLSADVIEKNLEGVAQVIEVADVVGLQEADGVSRWSGRIDHVKWLAQRARFGHAFRGDHSRIPIAAYGTALLSREPMQDSKSIPFVESWRDTKGFVISTIRLPAIGNLEVDFVSVHLDFLSPAVRRRQMEQLGKELNARERPKIVLGDFNGSFAKPSSPLAQFALTHGLQAFDAAASMPSYPANGPKRRLDWILASSIFDFVNYQTLPARVSDHCPVNRRSALSVKKIIERFQAGGIRRVGGCGPQNAAKPR